MRMPEHSYRLCVLTGVQPNRAQALLDESTGGLPQRFVYLPVSDPDAPDADKLPPPPLEVGLPALPMEWLIAEADPFAFGAVEDAVIRAPETFVEICVAADLWLTVREERTKGLRDDSFEIRDDDVAAHHNLMQLRLAAALMLLEGRTTIEVNDWKRAAVMLAVSDATVAKVRAAI